MKKVLFKSLFALLALVVVLLTVFIIIRWQDHKQLAKRISQLPVFTLSTLDGKIFNSSDIVSGPVLIIHFHPECEHCQYEIAEIFSNACRLAGTRLILISGAPEFELQNFMHQFNYSLYPDFSILVDTSDTFGRIFRNSFIPSHFVYNKELKLVKVLTGEYKLESILKYIEQDEFAE